jgi:hypothetical protein
MAGFGVGSGGSGGLGPGGRGVPFGPRVVPPGVAGLGSGGPLLGTSNPVAAAGSPGGAIAAPSSAVPAAAPSSFWRDDSPEVGASGPADSASLAVRFAQPNYEIPVVLTRYIGDLEVWAKGNGRDERKDKMKFLSLKLPAFLASGGASLLAHFKVDGVDVAVAAVAAICVLIDATLQPGMLRSVHSRAVHHLRQLQWDIRDMWDIGIRRDPGSADTLTAAIIEWAQQERTKIDAYLSDAEARMGTPVTTAR